MKKFLVLVLAAVVLAGCSSVSNLSTTRAPRNATGLYTVEARFKTTRQAVIDDSINAYVIVGEKTYKMERVPVVRDRWEGQIPVDPSQKATHYHFRFDYLVNSIPKAKPESYVSPEYGLDLK